MYRVGIDIGSTYVKYCFSKDNHIIGLDSEKTPIRQKQYFEKRYEEIQSEYPEVEFISCGYGKHNIPAIKKLNELTALAMGSFYMSPSISTVLDIGGQDTKIIRHDEGRLTDFFINDKCAAGSGMFLDNILKMLGISFDKVDLSGIDKPAISLSSVCAVFAQSEVVKLIAENREEEEIIHAVIWHILEKARPLIQKMPKSAILLSGGLTQIKGFREFAENILQTECRVIHDGAYLAAIGCTLGG